MSTKITVKYIDTGEERVWVWDGELLEAANEYNRRVKEWGEVASAMIDDFLPYTCWSCGKKNNYFSYTCYDCEAEGERQQDMARCVI